MKNAKDRRKFTQRGRQARIQPSDYFEVNLTSEL
jgi:hypothetical protein